MRTQRWGLPGLQDWRIVPRKEDLMGVVHVQLPDHIREAIDRQVAAGRVASEADFLIEAARRYGSEGPTVRKRTVRIVNTDRNPAILGSGSSMRC